MVHLFFFSYKSGDGTKAFSEGELKTFDEDKTGEAVVGGFSYKVSIGINTKHQCLKIKNFRNCLFMRIYSY